jgi:hypothetical protein
VGALIFGWLCHSSASKIMRTLLPGKHYLAMQDWFSYEYFTCRLMLVWIANALCLRIAASYEGAR